MKVTLMIENKKEKGEWLKEEKIVARANGSF